MSEKMNDESAVGNRTHHYRFRLNDEENDRFLDLFEKSGAHTKTKFILGRLFDRPFKVVKTDGNKHKFYAKLADFYSQFRGLATNYNQVTKKIHTVFDERKATYLLRELKAETAKLGDLMGEILALTEEFKQLWLSESGEKREPP